MALKIDLKKFLALAAVMSQGMNTACTIIDNTTGDEASNSDPTNTPASTTAVDPTSGGETGGTAGETGATEAGSDGTTAEAPTSSATEATSTATDATSTDATTGSGSFMCSNGETIDPMFVCDEAPDCTDNSDEVTGCGEPAFTCTITKQEVPASWACDEFADCADGSDEVTGCNIEPFVCADGLQEIPATFKCDMLPDCEDGSDELMCP